MDELLEQFLIEGPELAQQAGADLLALERSPDDAARIDGAFRAVHTLKGSVALFDLAPMGRALHAAEDLLGEVRSGALAASREIIDALLACIDESERWMAALAATGGLPADADARSDALVAALRACREEAGGPAAASAPGPSADWALELAARHGEPVGARAAVRYAPDAQAYFRGDDPLAIALATPELLALEVEPTEPAADPYDVFRCTLRFHLLSAAPPETLGAAFRLVADQVEIVSLGGAAKAAPAAPEAATSAGTRSLRVDAARLDALADLVDELAVARNALLAIDPAGDAEATARALRQSQGEIDRLTAALHRGTMRLRLTPIGPVFRRLERMGREVAASLGKAVELTVEGHDVEADKSVVDGLYEPLLHMLRNALDHGVETPAERTAAGKPERARVRLSARQAGDQVLVEVTDDGRGVDPARVRATALARGLASRDVLARMDEAAVVDLLFAPGFSTAERVSELSGRGVGMDAVRSAVSALGGKASLASRAGEGTTVSLTLPLTMVMTRVMVVEAGGERFGLPMQGIEETVAVPAARVSRVRHGRAFVHRDGTVPLVALSDLLALPSLAPSSRDRETTELKVLVAQAAGERVGVSVDRIVDRMDVVMRPMTGLLSGAPGVAGTTLTGDGRVLMILDLPELVA